MKIKKSLFNKKDENYENWRKEYKEVLSNEKYFEWLVDYAEKRNFKETLIDLYDPNILPEEMERVVLIPKLFKGIKEYGNTKFIPAIITSYGMEYVLEYKDRYFVFGKAKVTGGTYYYFKEVPCVKNAISFLSIIE